MNDDDALSSGERAAREYQAQAKAIRAMADAVGGPSVSTEENLSNALGRNILREEIGYFGKWDGERYNFDKETRDRLAAHSRQDIAAAYSLIRSTIREVELVRQDVARVRRAVIAGTLIMVSCLLAITAALVALQ